MLVHGACNSPDLPFLNQTICAGAGSRHLSGRHAVHAGKPDWGKADEGETMKMAKIIKIDENAPIARFDKPVTLQLITRAGGIIQTVLPANTLVKMVMPEDGWDIKIDFVLPDDLARLD